MSTNLSLDKLYEFYKKHVLARTDLGYDELTTNKCYKIPYKRDIIHDFFYFTPFIALFK
jgi:hypothetical protein